MDKELLSALAERTTYPEPTSTVALVQTHISVLCFTDRFVYKVKKGVDLGFLDFTTLERRHYYCQEELRLNRRLSPDLYLGVVALHRQEGSYRFEGTGEIVEYAVKMHRLPAERMLSHLLDGGVVTEADIRSIARIIGNFHLLAEQSEHISAFGTPAAIGRLWQDNLQQIATLTSPLSGSDLALIGQWVAQTLTVEVQRFNNRVRDGFIRECDGDIHADNICLADQVYIFDCIEFNERFRCSDTAADIAFFLMDLDMHRHPELAPPFLKEYLAVTNDREAVALLPFYQTYRAFVRGKVSSLMAADPQIAERERQRSWDKARDYFRLARGYILRQHLEPTMILMTGITGSGKSSIAGELAFQLGLKHINSDRVRKELAGIPATKRGDILPQGSIYTPAWHRRTYDEMLRQAQELLHKGEGVIVDATNRTVTGRKSFCQLAREAGCRLLLIQTFAPEEAIHKRLVGRDLEPTVSDGRWQTYLTQRGDYEEPTDSEGEVLRVDTTLPLDETIDTILRQLGVLSYVAAH
ncbi:MAG TPA: AAA family ATPase [Geobacterales bacterium]|nr:AAA family ATPase [Geobacterales bacterium]